MSKKILGIGLSIVGAALIFTGIGAPLGTIALGAGLGSITVASVIGLGLTIAGSLLAGPSAPKALSDPLGTQRLSATLHPTDPRKIWFGHTAGGTDIRYQVFNGANQEFLYMIVACASHAVHSIDELWLDNEKAWSGGSVLGRYSGYLTVTPILEGTSSNGIAIDSTWTSACTLTGCAYLYLKFKLTGNSDKVSSPFSSGVTSRMTIRGNGAKVYDPRLDSTVEGGSGSMRADDQTTWAWDDNGSRNPALQELFYELGWQINGKLAVGKGVPPSRIDLASYAVAANACDESVTLNGGGTEPRYRSDGVVSEADDTSSVRDNLCATMNAILRDAGGKLSLTVIHNDLATPVMPSGRTAFDHDDTMGELQWEQTQDLSSTFNVVRGRMIDASDTGLYQPVDFPDVTLPSVDGIDRIDSVDYPFVQSNGQAQRLAKQRLERNQYQGKLTFSGKPSLWGLNLGDVFPLTHPAFGWNAKLFRVAAQKINRMGQTDIVAVEENAAIYQWDNDEAPAVLPGAPTIYDPLNNPLVGGIEDASTAASNAQAAADAAEADATSALAQLTDMGDDGKLTPVEKRAAIIDYVRITGEQSDIDSKATLYSITTEKTNYDAAVTTLTAYLATLTTPAAWNDRSDYTTIVGTTWNANWEAVYSTRQLLLNKIAAVAKSLADAASSAAAAAAAAASAAQSDATNALAQLTHMGDDAKLVPVEKPAAINDYSRITAEQAGIDAQATSYAITTEKTNYDNAVSALTTYLATLTSPVAWNVRTDYTTIVAATWNSTWQAVYSARQTLLNKIAAVAGASAAAGDGNRVRFSLFERGTYGWGTGGNASLLANALDVYSSAGVEFVRGTSIFTATGQAIEPLATNNVTITDPMVIPVTAGERLFIGAIVASTGLTVGTWGVAVGWLNSSDVEIGTRFTFGTGHGALSATRQGGFITVPAGAVGMFIRSSLNNGADGAVTATLSIGQPIVCSAGASQTVFPAFTPGPGNLPTDNTTAYSVDLLASFSFPYTYDGTQNYTQQNVVAHLKDQAGANISSGLTWKYVVISGTVNGHAAGATEYAMTVDGAAPDSPYIPVTSLGNNANVVEIRAYLGATMWPKRTELDKAFAAAPAPSGGSGAGSLSVTTGCSGTCGSSTPVTVGSLSGTTPSGVTSVSLSASLDLSDISGSKSGSGTVTAKFQRLIGGTWTDIGSSGSGTARDVVYDQQDGSIILSATDSGLTASTAYQWRVIAWLSAGVDSISVGGSATVTG